MSFLSGLGGPLLSFGSSIIGDLFSQSGQESANAANMAMMQQSEQWQEHMSDTQMQRRVADLKAAGLNPMLAVGGPGAAMGSPVMAPQQNPGGAFGNLGSQVANALQVGAQVHNLNADADLKAANAASVRANTPVGINDPAQTDAQRLLKAQADNATWQIGLTQENISQVKAQTANLAASLPGIEAGASSAQAQAGVADKMAAANLAAQQISNALSRSKLPEAQAIANFYSANGGQVAAGAGQALPVLRTFMALLADFFGKK